MKFFETYWYGGSKALWQICMWEIKQLLLIRFHDDLLYLQNLYGVQSNTFLHT